MSDGYQPRVIEVSLLAIDLDTCGRCTGTLDSVEKAIDIVRPVLDASGIRLNVTTHVVDSVEDARRYSFVSSPTVRVDGRDIALEAVESHCEACSDLTGCDEGTDCRVWLYRGQQYTEAPVGLVIEGILREIFGGSTGATEDPAAYGEVPENLRRFFANKSSVAAPVQACCTPVEQETCCEPDRKATCCDDSEPGACGCR